MNDIIHLKYHHSTVSMLDLVSSVTQYQIKLVYHMCKNIFHSEELFNQHFHFIYEEDTDFTELLQYKLWSDVANSDQWCKQIY